MRPWSWAVLFLLVGLAAWADADEVELLNGTHLQGEVLSETPETIVFLSQGAELKLAVKKIYALTVKGQRRVLNTKAGLIDTPKPPKPGASSDDDEPPKPAQAPKPAATKAPAVSAASPGAGPLRSKAEVEALIQKEGSTPPAWWESVPLNYPATLDLSMDKPKPKSPWDAQKNVGQYFWSIINENPSKWKEGIRFANHLASVHASEPDKTGQALSYMAHLYQYCLGDYARAAYLLQKRGATINLDLALCYAKLGNAAMAKEILQKYGQDDTRFGSVIKLWTDIGELDTALKLADEKAKAGQADIAYLMAGDACRLAARYPQALAFYEKVLAVAKGARDIKQTQARAQASIEAIKVFDLLDLKKVKDGAYTSSSYGYSGQVQVEVKVKGARIESVRVSDHHEKQYYGSLIETPVRIIAKQDVKGVDTFSSATITSEAIINATAKALASGTK